MRRNKVPPLVQPRSHEKLATHADGLFDILLNSVMKDGTSKKRMQFARAKNSSTTSHHFLFSVKVSLRKKGRGYSSW